MQVNIATQASLGEVKWGEEEVSQSHQLELEEITGWPLPLRQPAKSRRLGESLLESATNGLSQNSNN